MISTNKGLYFNNVKRYPLYAFLLTLVVYTSALSGIGILGNGLNLLETSDWMTQQIPFILQMGEVIKGKHSLWYSWNFGLGGGSIGNYAYYTLSPFNFFYWILGEKGKHIASALVVILKAATSAMTFQIFISKYLRRTYYETILFSVLYALNGFAVNDYHSILSMDAVIIFPVIMCGIIILLRENKIEILVFAYSYLFFTSVYMGYVAGISSFIIFFFCCLYRRRKINGQKIGHVFFEYLLSVMISLGLTAFIWIPTVVNMYEFRNRDSLYERVVNCNPIMFLNNMFIGMYQSIDGFIPYYYCGLITVIALPLFLFNKRISSRKRKYFGLCLLTFIVIMLIQQLNFIIHGFDTPNAVGYRYAFVLSFIMVTVLAEQYVYMIGSGVVKFKYLIGLIISFVVIFFVGKYYITEKIGMEADSNTWYVFILNIAFIIGLYLVLHGYRSQKYDKLTKKTFFTVIIVLEVVCNIFLIHKRIVPKTSFIIDEQYVGAEDNTVRIIKEESEGDANIRTIYEDTYINNIAIEKGLSSVAYFSSLINGRMIKILEDIGYVYASNRIYGSGWTPVTVSLLGIDYIVDGACLLSDDPSAPVMMEANEHYYQKYIKNEKVLPLLFTVKPQIKDYETGNSVFDNQDRLLSSMTGKDVHCYSPIDMVINSNESNDVTVNENDSGVEIINHNYPEKEALLEYCTADAVDKDVYVNLYNDVTVYKDSVQAKGPIIEADIDVNVYHSVKPRIYPNQIFKSGNMEEKRSSFVMRIPAEMEKVVYKKGYFMEYDSEEFDKVYNELKDNAMDITSFEDGYVAGTVECSEECVLFSSIPYEKGWTAYVDGDMTAVLPIVEGAFVGLDLSKGHHDIVLEYVAPGRYAGRNVTIITIIALLVAMFYKKIVLYEKMNRKNEM